MYADTWVNTAGESIMYVLEEDQLLKITNDREIKSIFKTTTNLHMFRVKVKAAYPESVTKSLKSLFLICETSDRVQ